MCELQDLESTIPSTMDDNENENDAEATAATTTTNAFDPALLLLLPMPLILLFLKQIYLRLQMMPTLSPFQMEHGTKIYTVTNMNTWDSTSTVSAGKDYDKHLRACLSVAQMLQVQDKIATISVNS